MRVILRTRTLLRGAIDLTGLQPDALLTLSSREIANLRLPLDPHQTRLGEYFNISRLVSARNSLVVQGETSQVTHAGSGMASGLLILDGDAGVYTGSEMSGGTIMVKGNASDCLGVAMRGGMIRVSGNAGDWCGAAQTGASSGMQGGIILVMGSAGMETGSQMRRGQIAVAGNCGEFTAAGMLAGTVLCLGSLGRYAGIGMKRGSILTGCTDSILPGFTATGYADITWLRLLNTWLREQKFPLPTSWWNATLVRLTGDHLELGKGELIIHDCVE